MPYQRRRASRTHRRPTACITAGVLFLTAGVVHADMSIVLKNDFITVYKNRTSITTDFIVDKLSKVHPAKDDGDIHIAGRPGDEVSEAFLGKLG